MTGSLARGILCCGALLVLASHVAQAQRQLPPPGAVRDSAPRDTAVRRAPRRLPNSIPDSLLRPPITPKAAFLRSLLVPGWGQGGLRRTTAATLFSTAEAGAVYMVMKSRADLRRARALETLDSIAVGDPSLGEAVTRIPAVPQTLVNARRLHLEDWIAVLIFNHVLAGADAYVAANLWDLPARVSIRHAPGGGTISASWRW
ncbi:MAG: hypothetical protein IT355_19600 [Gemmatimonadaceae bacterium]|nr:hypothetical protein [Gemmatimonadaceae bacterium]